MTEDYSGDPGVTHNYTSQIELAREMQRWGFGDAVAGILAAFLLSNIFGAIIMAIAGWKTSSDIPIWGFGVVQIPLWAGYLAVVVLAGRKGPGFREAFGLAARQWDPMVGLIVGILCQLVLLPVLYMPILKVLGTDSDELSKPARELARGAHGISSWLLFAVLVGLVAPVVEEVFFRGLLLRSLSKRGLQPWVAVLLSSLIFAALHVQLLQLIGLFAFGLVLAALTVITGRLGPAIFAHIGFNMTTVVVLYLNYRSGIR